MINFPKTDKGDIYPEMSLYLKDNDFKFDIKSQPTIDDFQTILGEKVIKVAHCVLNIEQNFPTSTRQFIDSLDFEGKLIYYIQDSPMWNDDDNEYVYCLTYDRHIVKIGMTETSLKKRYQSYSCGTRKAMKKGSCSTTNYVITECNYASVINNHDVEIFAIPLPKETKSITRFGVTKTVDVSIARGVEEIVTDKFINTYGHKPVLCVQKGNSTI